ncbi:hypothetical protein F5Y14DRAFT_417838 [Nemania sp. NC0429]|nr:hypothetical protein F5Y14DRAFT_417838 [Nemania sp. NC0429]
MPSDLIMPLRQTCDRCRELKVRCKRGSGEGAPADGTAAISSRPCVRCSRVGIICTYSPRRRSGRHAQWGVQDETQKHTPYAPSANQSIDVHDVDWSWTYGLTGLDCSPELAGNTTLGCPLELDVAQTGPPESARESADERAKPPLSFARGKERSEVSDTTTSVAPTNGHWNHDGKPRDASTCDILDLNVRTARMLQSMASERTYGAECPSNDEMIDVASCLLKFIERLCRQISCVSCADSTHRVQSPPDGSSPLTQDSVAIRDSGTDQRPVAQSPDLSTVMLTLACHQRIVELFGYVCSMISSKIHDDHSLPALSPEPTSATTLSPGVGTIPNAQRVMTLELLNYLLHKLDRGQAQLADALRPTRSVGSVCSSTPSAESYATAISASPSEETYSGTDAEHVHTGRESLSMNTAGHLIMDRAMIAQHGLFTQIKVTKQMVTRIDGI